MLTDDDWDLVADNIAFIQQSVPGASSMQPVRFEPQARFLSLTEFVEGNISRPGVERGETGFLKPVIRRAFLDKHALRYDDGLRLGEDYELYVRALAAGARYKVIRHCGYGAIVRGNSLSGRHRTEDLRRLYEADKAILAGCRLSAEETAILREHEKHIRAKFEAPSFSRCEKAEGHGRCAEPRPDAATRPARHHARHLDRQDRALPQTAAGAGCSLSAGWHAGFVRVEPTAARTTTSPPFPPPSCRT